VAEDNDACDQAFDYPLEMPCVGKGVAGQGNGRVGVPRLQRSMQLLLRTGSALLHSPYFRSCVSDSMFWGVHDIRERSKSSHSRT